MLGRSGFLINSHDPLRVHVLKHIRQNSLTRLRYSVAEQGRERRKPKIKNTAKPVGGRKAPTYSPKDSVGTSAHTKPLLNFFPLCAASIFRKQAGI